ncbi:hypothetical protein, partial [Sphingomonas koreensis]|uniref:hypothetical protein n=1 Tax=Sphingomonas koreensis TaxID=93064 RepID=UPI0019CFF0A8
AGSVGGCPSLPALLGPWRAILHWRIWASSSFLRHYDEAQILLRSQPQICAIGADGGHTTYEYGANGTANNLFLKGKVVTADGISLRTCYGHDDFGNVLFVTTPGAGQGACQ